MHTHMYDLSVLGVGTKATHICSSSHILIEQHVCRQKCNRERERERERQRDRETERQRETETETERERERVRVRVREKRKKGVKKKKHAYKGKPPNTMPTNTHPPAPPAPPDEPANLVLNVATKSHCVAPLTTFTNLPGVVASYTN